MGKDPRVGEIKSVRNLLEKGGKEKAFYQMKEVAVAIQVPGALLGGVDVLILPLLFF